MAVRLVAACLFVLGLPAAADAQPQPVIGKQVRSSTKWGLELIAEGHRQSASFRRLVDSLRETNIVVYVQPAQELPGVTEAVTEFVANTGVARYLRIHLGVRAVRKRLIALLGHELQHAVEIGRAPEIVDVPSLEAFYRRTGELSVDGYDSQAGRQMGEVILRELWSRPEAPTAPRGVGTSTPPGGVTRN